MRREAIAAAAEKEPRHARGMHLIHGSNDFENKEKKKKTAV
jgi:hypothetical protein